MKAFFTHLTGRFAHWLPLKKLPLSLAVLKDARLWRIQRGPISRAVFLGTCCAFIPIPMQMPIAASLAILWRVHLPVSLLLVWISNPITLLPLMYAATWVGAVILDAPMLSYARFQMEGVMYPLANAIPSLLLGCALLGVGLGALLGGGCYMLWGYSVSNRRRVSLKHRFLRKRRHPNSP